jgi:hypothetical protein
MDEGFGFRVGYDLKGQTDETDSPHLFHQVRKPGYRPAVLVENLNGPGIAFHTSYTTACSANEKVDN